MASFGVKNPLELGSDAALAAASTMGVRSEAVEVVPTSAA
jgi:hypothetical protein